jgi:TRAP-type uncharacterized transport system fused permease subunit
MKRIIRFIAILIVSALAGFIKWIPDSLVNNTLFTINGIFFSIGYSVIIGFDLSGVTEKTTLKLIKQNQRTIEKSFLEYFSLATISFLAFGKCQYDFKIKNYSLSVDTILCILSLFALFYFIINYRELQKLKEAINDRIRDEKNREDQAV